MTDAQARHEAFMRRAVEEARAGMRARRGGPFGALITDPDGQVLSVAHNEVLGTQDCTMHAEIAAIRKAGRLDLRLHALRHGLSLRDVSGRRSLVASLHALLLQRLRHDRRGGL